LSRSNSTLKMCDQTMFIQVGDTVFAARRTLLDRCGFFARTSGRIGNTRGRPFVVPGMNPDGFRHLLALLHDENHKIPEAFNEDIEFYFS
jgi:hypothetical protein